LHIGLLSRWSRVQVPTNPPLLSKKNAGFVSRHGYNPI
jgi:hypothetical protein